MLPRVVQDKEGKAEWNAAQQTHTVTVPIDQRATFDQGFGDAEETSSAKEGNTGGGRGAESSSAPTKKMIPPAYEVL